MSNVIISIHHIYQMAETCICEH